MTQNVLLAAAFAAFTFVGGWICTDEKGKGNAPRYMIYGLLGLGLVFRMVTAVTNSGYVTDMNTFRAWASMVYTTPWPDVYETASFLDYPPGYLYVLWATEALRRLFGLEGAGAVLMIKLPSILADVGCTWLLLRLAEKGPMKSSVLICAALYLFSPAVFVNSAVWGQADGFCMLLLFAALLWMLDEKYIPAAVLYGAAILCKPQMLAFIPLFACWLWREKKLKTLLVCMAAALGTGLLLALPFTRGFNFVWLLQKYMSTMGSYPYFTINAYNLYGLAGLNWGSLQGYETVSMLLTVLSCGMASVLSGAVVLYSKRKDSLFAAGALLMATVFLLCPKMHERYLFPMFLLLLAAWVCNADRRLLTAYGLFSVLHYINVSYVLYLNNTYVSPTSPLILVLSLGHVAAYVMLVYSVWRIYMHGEIRQGALYERKPAKGGAHAAAPKKEAIGVILPASEPVRRMGRRDWILSGAVALLFAVISFTGLGSTVMPTSVWRGTVGQDVILQMSGQTDSLRYMPGVAANGSGRTTTGIAFTVSVSEDGRTWTDLGSPSTSTIFSWNEMDVTAKGTYLRIRTEGDAVLFELAAKAAGEDTFLTLSPLQGDCTGLVDEQDTVPLYRTPYNSAYFDEIYHPRTAYEHVLGCEPYENTHPTLGKLIMAAGVALFGMCPFGWRFMGALCGVLMLPVLYHLLWQLFGRTRYALFGTLLFALDFMHFTQTRIGTIDTYALLFILLMYDAMVAFLKKDLLAPMKTLLVPLALSGLFTGLGAAAKWTGVYAAVGLAVMYFGKLYFTWKKTESRLRPLLLQRMKTLCLWCVLLFGAIPFAVYFTAFLPVTLLPQNRGDVWGSFWRYQSHMLGYHAGLESTHYFASPWYEWPLMLRPIWYFSNRSMTASGLAGTISCMGNPLLWWTGIAAMAAVFVWALKDKTLAARVTAVGFLAAYLPWVGISRTTFIYHYFSAVPMLCIALTYVFWRMAQAKKPRCVQLGGVSAAVGDLGMAALLVGMLVLFIVFWPIMSGAPASLDYINSLEWLPLWYFS